MLSDSGNLPLSKCLELVDTPEGRELLSQVLRNGPFPHFEPHPAGSNQLARIDADGFQQVIAARVFLDPRIQSNSLGVSRL